MASGGAQPVGDLEVVDTRPARGHRLVPRHALLQATVAEDDPTILDGEAVAVVPSWKTSASRSPRETRGWPAARERTAETVRS